MIIQVLLVSIAHHLVSNYCRWCFYEMRNQEFLFLYYQHQSLQHTVYRQGHKVQAGYKYFLLHLGRHQVITLIKYLQRMLMVKSFSDYYYWHTHATIIQDFTYPFQYISIVWMNGKYRGKKCQYQKYCRNYHPSACFVDSFTYNRHIVYINLLKDVRRIL